jgi:hypothetical protein
LQARLLSLPDNQLLPLWYLAEEFRRRFYPGKLDMGLKCQRQIACGSQWCGVLCKASWGQRDGARLCRVRSPIGVVLVWLPTYDLSHALGSIADSRLFLNLGESNLSSLRQKPQHSPEYVEQIKRWAAETTPTR